MARGLFAYDPAGRVFAMGCGSELLVHDGASEAPLWKAELDGEIVAVDVSGDELVVLLARGALARFGLKTGREIGRVDLGKPAIALAVSTSAWLAVAHDESVSLLRRGDFGASTLEENGVRALAWSGDGMRLLLGAENALVELERPERSPSGRRVVVEGTPAAIAWSPRGEWLVAIAERVVRFAPGAEAPTHVTRVPAGKVVSDIAISADGSRFAIQMDQSDVIVLSDPPKDTLASLKYPERSTRGIRFGPSPWIGVALDTGDANKLDYQTGALHRSDTHPGREHTRWLVAVTAGPPKKKASAPTPAAPEANPRRRPPADLDYDPPPQPEGPSIITILRIILAIVALVAALARCH